MIREANKNDLDEILQLYLYLHEKSIPEDSEHLRSTWDNIMKDANHHLIVCETDGKIVASCVWNIHHILPKTCGGTNAISNLICTNIATNDEAADKITFWIDDCLYQVKKTEDGHDIFQIK